jgi:hypothetical protein
MAKRARGHVRPGQRRAIDRRPAPAAAPAAAGGTTASAAPRPAGLTEAELARAAELEAQLLAEERAAETARTRTQPRAKSMGRSGPSSLELRAEVEYAYVARDVKDIVRVMALLFTVLFGLWIVIDKLKIVPIG